MRFMWNTPLLTTKLDDPTMRLALINKAAKLYKDFSRNHSLVEAVCRNGACDAANVGTGDLFARNDAFYEYQRRADLFADEPAFTKLKRAVKAACAKFSQGSGAAFDVSMKTMFCWSSFHSQG